MNSNPSETEREELERLKRRQAELSGQINRLASELAALEVRLTAPPTPEVLKVEQPQPAPKPIPVPTPQPRNPANLPPIIAQVVAKPVIQPAAQAASGPPSEPLRVEQTVAENVNAGREKFEQSPPMSEASRPARKGSFELRLGTFWLAPIGIIMLLTGLVFFGAYAYENFIPKLGPGAKVALLYFASGALLGVGAWLQRKSEALRNYGQVLMAGGLAAVYFTTYAAHHIPNLRVISSALVDGLLLLGVAGFTVRLADRKKSEVLALFAILLAFYTSVITNVGLFTLYSNLVLTLTAVFFLVRNRWATLSFASLVATYVSYAFWRFYQNGEWHLVRPEEGLWTGNYFLISYWIIFTAALFLSKHQQFVGTRRASFLSLNNAAFFTAFLVTMLQVHTGGFWKFSLIYGGVLLGLSALAWRLRGEDASFRNAYLTQGLLLVTLGLVTKFSGLRLSLILAVESVSLVVLGRMLRSRVMQVASFIAAGLAVFWGATMLQPFDQANLLSAGVVGASMLFNAWWHRDEAPQADIKLGLRSLYFTLLGLAIWLVATWQNTAPEWRGLWLAAESMAFLVAARPLRNLTLPFGSIGFASFGVSWELFTLAGHWSHKPAGGTVGLLPAVAIGAIMLGNALWQQRSLAATERQVFQPSVSTFSFLGLLVWLAATLVYVPTKYLAPCLAGEALLLTAAFYPLRLKETALFGQLFLLLAQVLWIDMARGAQPQPPWWNPATVIAITLALSQWWQRQRVLHLSAELRRTMQGVYALAVVGLLFFWLQPSFSAPAWLAFSALLAVLLTAYGVLTRDWLVALAGQIFVLVSGFEFFRQVLLGQPEWWYPFMPVAALLLLSFGTVKWFQLRPGANQKIAAPLLNLSLVYRMAAAAMSLWWIDKYIPVREQIWVLALVGLVLFALAGWQRSREILIFGGVFTLVGIGRFWFHTNGAASVYWADLLALLILPAQQLVAKRSPERFVVVPEVHAAVMVVGALSLWLYLSRWVEMRSEGFYLTASWAFLALILFVAGMGLRERVYRWLGLSVLACALGRVVIFDIWRLERIYQILSFMALGIVLLVLGALYNKYQERLRQWL